uniref:Bestrophin homolog n=1 Tax=Chaetoceros debilis TaxID=122233 RepID=A0A7S3V5C9_9STRA|mmetsp:Transcript_18523/g.27323  ORF Transcript_18523/g.27323 Transcript_18523/m.27323 type:complete len:417 (+) Transcript_18523:56-1306(+)
MISKVMSMTWAQAHLPARPAPMRSLFLLFLLSGASLVQVESSVIPSPAVSSQIQQAVFAFKQDLERVKNLPVTSLTAPCEIVCTDSTYTKSWTFNDWECHQSTSLKRYARHFRTWVFSSTAKNIVPTICVVGIWTAIVSKLSERSPKFQVGTTKMTVALTFVQAPILLLLTLRTNRALDRLLEARRAWGALTKTTRALTGMVCAYIIPYEPKAGVLMARYIALCGWSLKTMLRRQDDDTEMVGTLFEYMTDEKEWLLNCDAARPTAIVVRLRHLLSVLGKDTQIDDSSGENTARAVLPPIALLRMEEILYEIEQCIGISYRILRSPIPPTYTRHTSRTLVFYMCLLPVALAGMNIPLVPAIITACFASYVLVGIDEIGLEIENPFSLLPMQSIAKTIQTEVENQVDLLATLPPFPK